MEFMLWLIFIKIVSQVKKIKKKEILKRLKKIVIKNIIMIENIF